MAEFIDQLFCPNMPGLLIVKIRLREVAGSIPDKLRFFIIILGQYCTGQLYLSVVLPYVKIGLREGRGIDSRRAQKKTAVRYSCFCLKYYYFGTVQPVQAGQEMRKKIL
jgi:hypothetical protein